MIRFIRPSAAFIAIGHIAAAVGSEMKTFLEPLMSNIKEALRSRGYVNLSAHS